jgi:hypothetical protein
MGGSGGLFGRGAHRHELNHGPIRRARRPASLRSVAQWVKQRSNQPGVPVWPGCESAEMVAVREELLRLLTFEERHRRLLSRLALVLAATVVLDACGTLAIYFLERHARGTELHSLGDALFFTTVQLLTVSSQLKNPLTPAGRVVDVVLELWAVVVVAGSAGAIASFFQSSDSR